MASDIKTTSEDADMSECDGEKVVTMMDVLQEQEDFEEDANAVLGASDDKNCTYSKGYIKRQALYACLTCCPEAKSDPKKRAGVCLACSLMCHENHELIELYTKRNFRCDCGNPKFNSHPCSFTPVKSDLNEDNFYNQNFSGLYCTCQRPYPDPESTVEDEMIQCIICEDWLHASHLESTVPTNEQYSEMICKICMDKNEFLHDYSNLAINTDSVEVDIVTVNGSTNNSNLSNGNKTEEATDCKLNQIENKPNDETSEEKLDTSVVTKDTTLPESVEENENKCISKDESDKENTTENPMETEQSEQDPQTNLSSEKTTSNITPELSNEQSQPDNINEGETKAVSVLKSDEVSKDTTDDTAMVCDNLESSTNAENISEESKAVEMSKDQQDSETNINKLEANNIKDEAENTKIEDGKSSSMEAEKMEEDRLLADPEDDNQKTATLENNDNTIDKDSSTKDSDPVEMTNEPKAEIKPTSDNAENSITGNENCQTDANKISNETIVQNENNSNNHMNSENIITSTESESENRNQLKNLPREDNNSMEATTQSDNKELESSSTKKEESSCNKEVESGSSEKRKYSEENSDNVEAKKPKLEDNLCIRPKGIKKIYKGATFWPSNFRQKLCTCQECLSMYNDLSVLFLTDPEDTVSAYESLGKQKINGEPSTQYEKGLQALSSLDRVQQINALTEYNRMRDKLLDFLKSFKDKKEIVKEEDIKAFFAGMKPKRQPDGVYFCR
ncbi:putative E3 ubiquitin-protein ligase UBR7 [Vanessa cardui]|uniref:putative E3 ubiquitin-protein ligase UBR7 n=1 Tax=Vanessa cardui TaxID=171605 RepID=UPI001F142300|nr:putative E3 ubiquitin-protein ligase UBR7 [Vanessa cardui]